MITVMNCILTESLWSVDWSVDWIVLSELIDENKINEEIYRFYIVSKSFYTVSFNKPYMEVL